MLLMQSSIKRRNRCTKKLTDLTKQQQPMEVTGALNLLRKGVEFVVKVDAAVFV